MAASVVVLLLCSLAPIAVGPSDAAGAATADWTPRGVAFVSAAYHDLLGRAPTAAETRFITTAELSSSPDRESVVLALARSPEWVGRTVDALYLNTLGRSPDAGGRAYWVRTLTLHRATVAQVSASFYSSREYFTGFGRSSVSIWVQDLYAKVLRRTTAASATEIAYWVDATARRGRSRVAADLVQSYESRGYRVDALYAQLLDRSPDASGRHYWIRRLVSGDDLALAARLGGSTEYYLRSWDRYGSPVSPSGPVTRATLTSETGMIYSYRDTGSSTKVTPGQPGSDWNVREVFWYPDARVAADQEFCIDWDTPGTSFDPPIQPGVALRIAPVRADGTGTKAITVTQNVFYGGTWLFNVHVWESTNTVQPFTLLASYDVGSIIRDNGGLMQPSLHVCARTIGNTFDFEVWKAGDPQPSWSDPTHVFSTALPPGWDYPGRAGGYVGHLRPGQYAVFSNHHNVG